MIRSLRARRIARRALPAALALIWIACGAHAQQETNSARILDAFDDLAAWSVITADGVGLTVSADVGRDGAGHSARLDYDFTRGSGYAIIRKRVDLPLPENYQFSYFVRAAESAPRNTMEFKLIDPSGDNVWWVNKRDFEWPSGWTRITLPKRKITFAWGPAGAGTPLTTVGFIEIVVTASTGGKGTVWIDELAIEGLPPVLPYAGTPVLTVPRDLRVNGRETRIPIAPDGTVNWRSDPGDSAPAPRIDFGQVREFGGLILTWDRMYPRGEHPSDYQVLLSLDGKRWTSGAEVRESCGGANYVQLPDAVARYVDIRTPAGRKSPVLLKSVRVMPPDFGESANAMLLEVAKEAPRGHWPRAMRGEASYWTVMGADGDPNEALISEDGAIEVDRLGFTLEPFLNLFTPDPPGSRGTFRTWTDGTTRQELLDGYLPIPTVVRESDGLQLRITAFVDGGAGTSRLLVRYELRNVADKPRTGELFIAVRPLQVNPPYQNLNIIGGSAPIRSIRHDGPGIEVDGRHVAASDPGEFAATRFDSGEIVSCLAQGLVPREREVNDPRGLASGAFRYELNMPSGQARAFWFVVPFNSNDAPAANGELSLDRARAYWQDRLNRVAIRLPKSQQRIADSIRANLAYILINRDGPGLQPGSRSYERTWIRDGALTSSALLAMGLDGEVRDFLDWFAPFQYDSGKIPCCVDKRGPDPVPEHDSHGEYIAAVRAYFDFTSDRAFALRHWPRVLKAVAYIEQLRSQRTTDEFAKGPDDKRVLYGLMPESISHEGYSAKPMHSYWDDFWTLKGLRDAAHLAAVLGETGQHARLDAHAKDFQRTLTDSIALAARLKHINYVPGCAELGDFDATSTTIAMFPCGWQPGDLRPLLEQTFDRYWDFFRARRDGLLEWKDYTPYEHRIVGSMVMLGHRDRALEMLDFFFHDQRPQGWRHWAEVVRKDPRQPGFIGDMPHTWCGSDFINSIRTMLAFRRDADDALILAAGLPREWLEDPEGVEIGGLRTEYGPLNLRARAENGSVHINIDALASPPPGGAWLWLPDAASLTRVRSQGRDIPWNIDPARPGLVRLDSLPADVTANYRASP